MEFMYEVYPIWSKGSGEMVLDGQTDRWTDGWTEKAVTIIIGALWGA